MLNTGAATRRAVKGGRQGHREAPRDAPALDDPGYLLASSPGLVARPPPDMPDPGFAP